MMPGVICRRERQPAMGVRRIQCKEPDSGNHQIDAGARWGRSAFLIVPVVERSTIIRNSPSQDVADDTRAGQRVRRGRFFRRGASCAVVRVERSAVDTCLAAWSCRRSLRNSSEIVRIRAITSASVEGADFLLPT
jgi:hypothetical protein